MRHVIVDNEDARAGLRPPKALKSPTPCERRESGAGEGRRA